MARAVRILAAVFLAAATALPVGLASVPADAKSSGARVGKGADPKANLTTDRDAGSKGSQDTDKGKSPRIHHGPSAASDETAMASTTEAKPPSARTKVPMYKGDREKDAKTRGGRAPMRPVVDYSPTANAAKAAVVQRRKRLAQLEAKAKEASPAAEIAAKTLRFMAERRDGVLGLVRQEVTEGKYEQAYQGLRRMARGQIPPPVAADKAPPKEGDKPGEAKTDPDAGARAQAEELARPIIQNEAAVMLGDLHMEGKGVPKSHSLARGRFLAAAKRGSADAAYRLALLSEQGIGVPRSSVQAVEWYEVAAYGDHIPASIRLAQAFRRGELELRSDPRMAKAWYREAAKLGSEEAKQALAEMEAERPTPQPGVADAAAAAGRDLKQEGLGGGLMPSSLPGPEGLGEALGQAMGDIMGRMATAMVEGITGALGGQALQNGTEEKPDGAFDALIGAYVAAVNAKDLAALKTLFNRDSMACTAPEGQADDDRLLAEKFAKPLDAVKPPGVRLTRLAAEGSLPYENLFDYPRRPTHYAAFALAGADGAPTTMSTALIKGDAGWSFVFPCLKPEARAMMASAPAPAADNPDHVTVPPREPGRPLKLEPGQGGRDGPERAGEVALQGGGAAFLEKFTGYLKAKDTLGLDGLIHPTARACITAKTAPFFAFVNKTLMDIDFAKGPEIRTYGLKPGYGGTAYRPSPTHEVAIKYGMTTFAGGKGRSWQSVSLYLVNEGDRWHTVPPCPTQEQMSMLPMLKALYEGMAKGTVQP